MTSTKDSSHTIAWTLPNATLPSATMLGSDWNTDMFKGCTNVNIGTPQLNKTYYQLCRHSYNENDKCIYCGEAKPKTYSVTLIAGLTRYPYHGAEQQTNLLGAMEPVYYTADEDYYIQDDYPMITKNGITVVRYVLEGWGPVIVVNGTPTADTTITLPAAIARNVTPNPEPNPKPEPNPEPTPNPNPEPTPTPTPAPNPTPDPAPTTSTPAASTTTASTAAAPAQVTYDILDGAGSSWTQNTDGSLAIRGSGEISKFREVKVDGVTVDPVNYTVTEGSTIITFKPEYLKSLSAGNHSFELVWTDGTAATNFTVAENADQSAKSPKTGEDFSMALCTALLMVSCAGLAGMFVRRKKSSLR